MKKRKEYWRSQVIRLHIDVYDTDVVLSINTNGRDTLKKIKPHKRYLEEVKSCCDGWDAKSKSTDGCMYQVGGGFLVFLDLQKGKFRTGVSLLVHELTHVVHYLLRDRRIPLSEETEEAHTYLIQYLTKAALVALYD